MTFQELHRWHGNAEKLAKEIEHQIERLGLAVDPPAVRTVRLWRSKQIFSQPKGQEFGFRQILEGLLTALLLKKGWTLAAIGQTIPSCSELALEQQIIAQTSGADSQMAVISVPIGNRQAIDLAEDAVVLLAQGIVRQYERVLNREIVRQEDTMPPELYKSMCKLGRLYIEQGEPDRAACLHAVLERSRYRFDDERWGLNVFQQPEFRFSDAIAIDPDLRVPTSDCIEIARSSGAGEDNIIEHRLYKQLLEATGRLGSRRQHQAYTALREMVGRQSLIAERQLGDYLLDRDLTPLQTTIGETLFDPVPEAWLIDGLAHRCASCGTLMRPHPNLNQFPAGRCPIRQCHSVNAAKVGEKLDPSQDRLLIAKPQILTYWTGPAIDELAIFDVAIQLGLNAELYPESDLCDVSVNGRAIGIDAKSYLSPVSLALRLNRSIGGLIHYRRRILAVSDRLLEQNPSYLSTLRSTLDKKGDPATLEIVTVSSAIEFLQEISHAN
jgi:REase associating with pPIWI_RE